MLFLFLLCNWLSPYLVIFLSSVMEELSKLSIFNCPWLWLNKMYLKKHKETIIPKVPITFLTAVFVMFVLQDMRSHRFAYKTEETHLDLVPLLSKLAFPLSHNAVSNFKTSSSHISKLCGIIIFLSYSSCFQMRTNKLNLQPRSDALFWRSVEFFESDDAAWRHCSHIHICQDTNVLLFAHRFKKLTFSRGRNRKVLDNSISIVFHSIVLWFD